MKINMIPEMGIVKEVPVVLNSTTFTIDDEGDRSSDTRIIIWTLNFTVKGFVFGANSPVGLIRASITNIYNDLVDSSNIQFSLIGGGLGEYTPGEIIYQGNTLNTAFATARIVKWDKLNQKLIINNITGNFISTTPVIGELSHAMWSFTSYVIVPNQLSQIVVTPSATDANSNTQYVITTQINENSFGNSQTALVSANFSGDMTIFYGADDLNVEFENITDLANPVL